MGRIFCFMGKSSTGKDTIFKRLIEEGEPKLYTLVPYTTRPIRDGETEGVEYFFTDELGYLEMTEQGRVIEERSYDTYHGLWRYFTVDDGHIDLAHKNYAIIGTLEAYGGMCRTFGRDKVLPVLIEVDDGIRLQRALERERLQDNPRYEELCRRFLADCEDFRETKIADAGITLRFQNDNLESCIKKIREYLQRYTNM